MQRPHREGGRGEAANRHTDSLDPSQITPGPQRRKYAAQSKWRDAHPKARWAHVALQSALRRGLLKRGPCEVCGATETGGHHDDYEKPAAVRWLCRKHGRAEHAKARAAK
jgi:hypothetical protein